MTFPVPPNAFDHAHAIGTRRKPRPLDRGRLVSLGLTAAFHVAAVMGLLAMVHVAPVRHTRVMMVQISTEKPKQARDDLPPPRLI